MKRNSQNPYINVTQGAPRLETLSPADALLRQGAAYPHQQVLHANQSAWHIQPKTVDSLLRLMQTLPGNPH